MSSTEPPETLAFGVFEVEPQSGEVRKQGLKVKLRRRESRVLLALLESPGQLVTRGELRQRLWPDDTFVEFDNGLNNAVSQLRSVLGDSAENPRFIETVPRQGYRFLAPMARHETRSIRVFPVSRWAASLALLVVALGAVGFVLRWSAHRTNRITSLAVLPLVSASRSDTPGQVHLAEAMTRAIRIDLSQIGALMLASPKTGTTNTRSRKSLAEIARELQVDAIVKGSVRSEDDGVQVNVQLIRSASGALLWTGTFRYQTTDIPRIARAVVRGIVQAASVKLTPQEQQDLASHLSVNPQADGDHL